MTAAKKLVIGASGFVGSHVTRQLVDCGDDVRVLEAAVDADMRRFVFTSTIGTIGIPAERRPATEEDEFNWPDKGGGYIRSRVEAGGARRPRFGIPLRALYVIGYVGDVVGRVLRRDTPVTSTSVRLTHIMAPMDHGKAGRELGWQPGPIHDSIRRAAQFYRENRRSSR
jgi:nucleoside-diphosphate-sugar epimerase